MGVESLYFVFILLDGHKGTYCFVLLQSRWSRKKVEMGKVNVQMCECANVRIGLRLVGKVGPHGGFCVLRLVGIMGKMGKMGIIGRMGLVATKKQIVKKRKQFSASSTR